MFIMLGGFDGLDYFQKFVHSFSRSLRNSHAVTVRFDTNHNRPVLVREDVDVAQVIRENFRHEIRSGDAVEGRNIIDFLPEAGVEV